MLHFLIECENGKHEFFGMNVAFGCEMVFFNMDPEVSGNSKDPLVNCNVMSNGPTRVPT